ncbi:hypothetical protein [Pleomorphovibrio marinus]|uniref:hypothetical protein n=1 Tax=Pleomorphovibrio marinus TaxID=2164132 RepID=UPI00130063FF|nr:hypothetical protein [Pleomorphovibrio marinus]
MNLFRGKKGSNIKGVDYWPGGGDGDAGGDFHSGKNNVTPLGLVLFLFHGFL